MIQIWIERDGQRECWTGTRFEDGEPMTFPCRWFLDAVEGNDRLATHIDGTLDAGWALDIVQVENVT